MDWLTEKEVRKAYTEFCINGNPGCPFWLVRGEARCSDYCYKYFEREYFEHQMERIET